MPSAKPAETAPQKAATTAPPRPPPAAAKIAPRRDFLEAKQVSVYQLFDNDDFKFDIPLYQRPYSWRTKHVWELMQDLLTAYNAKTEYFLGAIVTTKIEDGQEAPYQVIDGQQRLTTLFIMLAYLHSWAREQQNEILEQRIKRMLFMQADPLDYSSVSRYRLKLREADDDFFRANILDEFLPTAFTLTGLAASDPTSDDAINLASPSLRGASTQALRAALSVLTAPVSSSSRTNPPASQGPGLRSRPGPMESMDFASLDSMDHTLSSGDWSSGPLSDVMAADVSAYTATLPAASRTAAAEPSAPAALVWSASLGGASAQEEGSRGALAVDLDSAEALENETWWRLYENATFVREQMGSLVDGGLNLQDFMLHSLRNCYVVVMNARDESSSFSIFSTLNGRGMDLSVVDKLKADLLQALEPRTRGQYSEAWAEMESILGRTAFHKVFDYMRELAATCNPAVEQSTLLEYFTAKKDDPACVKQEYDESLEGSGLSPEDHPRGPGLRIPPAPAATGKLGAPDPKRLNPLNPLTHFPLPHIHTTLTRFIATSTLTHATSTPTNAHHLIPGGHLRAHRLLPRLRPQHSTPISSSSSSSPTPTPPQAQPTFSFDRHFSAQLASAPPHASSSSVHDANGSIGSSSSSSDTAAATDADTTASDGRAHTSSASMSTVGAAPLAAGSATGVTGAVVAELDVSEVVAVSEADLLLQELCIASRHVNLLADEGWLPPTLEFFYQHEDVADRVAFLQGVEALQLYLELEGDVALRATRWAGVCATLLTRPFSPADILANIALSRSERASFRSRIDSKDFAAVTDPRTVKHLLLRCEPTAYSHPPALSTLHVEKLTPQHPPEGSLWRKTKVSAANSQEEAKYWYEVQRMFTHAKLGNLVLLPSTASSARLTSLSEYEAKASFYTSCGGTEAFPSFTGVTTDRYGKYKFSYEEAQRRQMDIVTQLTKIFHLEA
ncbi:MAG: hypothetical protein WDW38_008825 [Sanguina aurantia]